MTTVALAILAGGLITFFFGLPLAYRKIPMNSFYGFRVQEAFESKQRWYDINAYAGRQTVIWSWLIIAAGAVGFFVPRAFFAWYAFACIPLIWLALWRAVLRFAFVPINRIIKRSRRR
jgi:hypothetical protein